MKAEHDWDFLFEGDRDNPVGPFPPYFCRKCGKFASGYPNLFYNCWEAPCVKELERKEAVEDL